MSLEGSHRACYARVGPHHGATRAGPSKGSTNPKRLNARRICDAACWMRSSDDVSASVPVRYDGSTVTVYEKTSSGVIGSPVNCDGLMVQ
jgi:hypothetical protein